MGWGEKREKVQIGVGSSSLPKGEANKREKGAEPLSLLCNAPFLGAGGWRITDCNRHWAMNLVVIK